MTHLKCFYYLKKSKEENDTNEEKFIENLNVSSHMTKKGFWILTDRR